LEQYYNIIDLKRSQAFFKKYFNQFCFMVKMTKIAAGKSAGAKRGEGFISPHSIHYWLSPFTWDAHGLGDQGCGVLVPLKVTVLSLYRPCEPS